MDLFPHVPTVVFQIVNFVILAVLLYYVLFKPVMRSMKVRAEERSRIEQDLATELAAAAEARDELGRRLAEAEKETDSIVAAAQERAAETAAATLRQAREEAERILSEAHEESQRLRTQAEGASQSRTVDAILQITQEVIGRNLPPEVHDRLVQQLSDRIWEMGRSEMGRVEDFRRSLGDRTPTAHVVTGKPLSPEQQGLLARTFTALADRHVDLEVQDDPSLGAGLRVRLADIVIDGSIAGQLEQLREDTLEALRNSA